MTKSRRGSLHGRGVGVGQAEPSEVSFGQSLEEEKEPTLCAYRERAPGKRRAPRRVPAENIE